MAEQATNYPVVFYKVDPEDSEYKEGVRYYVETIDMDKFYAKTKKQIDDFCRREGLTYVASQIMDAIRSDIQ